MGLALRAKRSICARDHQIDLLLAEIAKIRSKFSTGFGALVKYPPG